MGTQAYYCTSPSVKKERIAQDIYSTSSSFITFNNIPKKVMADTCMAPPVMGGPKKKKIRLTSNKSIEEKEEVDQEESEAKTKSNAMEYVCRLKKKLNDEEMKEFKRVMQQYKVVKQFEVLIPMLKNVIMAYQHN